jgi:hypothetical protein
MRTSAATSPPASRIRSPEGWPSPRRVHGLASVSAAGSPSTRQRATGLAGVVGFYGRVAEEDPGDPQRPWCRQQAMHAQSWACSEAGTRISSPPTSRAFAGLSMQPESRTSSSHTRARRTRFSTADSPHTSSRAETPGPECSASSRPTIEDRADGSRVWAPVGLHGHRLRTAITSNLGVSGAIRAVRMRRWVCRIRNELAPAEAGWVAEVSGYPDAVRRDIVAGST